MRRSHRSVRVVAGALVLLAVSLVTSTPSVAAPPPAPVVTPPDGTTIDTDEIRLRIDLPDVDESLTTEFFLRRFGGDPFTVVVLPDTQHYTDDEHNWPNFRAQTEWVVGHRDELNVVFTTHLGDIVQHHRVREEWLVADDAIDVLDDADLPVGMSPGNHDTSKSGKGRLFDVFFPPSRWNANAWYGGHLGSDPRDPVDTMNRNSFQLFESGLNEFLILHLDWTVPGHSLGWAQRIIDEHPDRRVIISTHIFMDADGVISDEVFVDRSGGRSARTVLDELVLPNCDVFLVLGGHYFGEADRTETNRCGDPVHLVTADYQARPNGGDGWLRYLVFDPASDTIENVTYSPVLDRFEKDADSAFVLHYDLAAAPTAFERVGRRVTTGKDVTGVKVTGLAPGRYEWFARVSTADGAGMVKTPVSTFGFVEPVVADEPPSVSGLRYVPGPAGSPGRIVADLADDSRVAQARLLVGDNRRSVYWQGGSTWGARTIVDVTPVGASTTASLDVPLVLEPGGYRVKLWVYDDASQEELRRLEFSVGESTAADDVVAPTSIIETPVGGAAIDTPFVVAGSADDDRGVTEVRVVVKDLDRSRYWNGTDWQEGWAYIPASLTEAGAPSTAWSYRFDGPVTASRLSVSSRAFDAARNKQDPIFVVTLRP